MTETQKIYHELEMMQELGMLEEETDICELTTQRLQEIQDTIKEEPTSQDLENHMVLPTVNEE